MEESQHIVINKHAVAIDNSPDDRVNLELQQHLHRCLCWESCSANRILGIRVIKYVRPTTQGNYRISIHKDYWKYKSTKICLDWCRCLELSANRSNPWQLSGFLLAETHYSVSNRPQMPGSSDWNAFVTFFHFASSSAIIMITQCHHLEYNGCGHYCSSHLLVRFPSIFPFSSYEDHCV